MISGGIYRDIWKICRETIQISQDKEERIIQNRQIAAYLEPREFKQHEQELLAMIQIDYPQFNGHMLDIGCATGNFIQAMQAHYPEANYTGIDISADLISIARTRLTEDNVYLLVEDVLRYQPVTTFDMIIASGVLSIFEEFEPVLDRWLSWLKKGGRVYIFGRFNSRNIDTIIRFRNNYVGGDWEGGLTSYAVHTVANYLEARGFRYTFKRFYLNVELAERDDPIRTYTIPCVDGSRLVVNGANTIAEHYFLTISKPG